MGKLARFIHYYTDPGDHGGGDLPDPLNTFVGSIVRFMSKAAKPIVQLTAALSPIQSGTGDPSPDNVRPISGWTGCKVFGTGVNIFGGDLLKEGLTHALPSGTLNTENKTFAFSSSATQNGTITDGVLTIRNSNGDIIKSLFKENTAYTFIITCSKSSGTSTNLRVNYKDGTYDNIGSLSGTAKQTKVFVSNASKTVSNLGKYTASGTTTLYYDESGIFEGVHTADDFVAYQGTATEIDFDTTVYGGTLTVNEDGTGSVVATMVGKFFDGTEKEWKRSSSYNGSFYIATGFELIPYATTNESLCTHAIKTPGFPGNYAYGKFGFDGMPININFNVWVAAANTSLDDFKTYLAGQSQNGTPLGFVCKLATPITIPLTPGQVEALQGQNVVWVDDATGDITVQAYGTAIT